jgi:hypothetical protein
MKQNGGQAAGPSLCILTYFYRPKKKVAATRFYLGRAVAKSLSVSVRQMSASEHIKAAPHL